MKSSRKALKFTKERVIEPIKSQLETVAEGDDSYSSSESSSEESSKKALSTVSEEEIEEFKS